MPEKDPEVSGCEKVREATVNITSTQLLAVFTWYRRATAKGASTRGVPQSAITTSSTGWSLAPVFVFSAARTTLIPTRRGVERKRFTVK